MEIDLDFRLCPCPIPGKKKTQINFRAQLTNQLPPMEGLGGLLFLNNKSIPVIVKFHLRFRHPDFQKELP